MNCPNLFIHIPKCGGVSIQQAAAKVLAPHETTAVGVSKGKISYEEFEKLILDAGRSFQGIKWITGHIQYRQVKGIIPERNLFTVLREPVDRFVSQFSDIHRKGVSTYNHLLRRKDVNPNDILQVANKSLKEFLNMSIATKYGNMQTKYLSTCPPHEEPQQRHLDEVKKLLDQMTHFGILKYDTVTFQLLGDWLRLPQIEAAVLNVSLKKPSIVGVTADVVHKIREVSALDAKLYDHAHALFLSRFNARRKAGLLDQK